MSTLKICACCAWPWLALLMGGCSDWSAPPSHEELIQQDLAKILRAQGLPCPQVNSFTQNDRLDYRVECSSGDTYRIQVSPEGVTRAADHP